MRSLVIYAASGCNLRCKHCAVGSDQAKPRPSLTKAQICSILENAANAGVRSVTLIGGEIFHVHRDLTDVFSTAEKSNIEISINTNLHFVKELSQLFQFSSLKNVSFSLDGASSYTHDRVRGKGSFERVLRSLAELSLLREARPDVSFDTTFVLNKINKGDAVDLFELIEKWNVRKLNLAVMENKDFAARNADVIGMSGLNLINSLSSFLLYWLSQGKCLLETNITPLLSVYLQERFGVSSFPSNFSGCGGTEVYGYIDNSGNHLPCPSMSYEHGSSLNARQMPHLNAALIPLQEIWERSTFKGFERARSGGGFVRKMQPCSSCVFSDECRPCTHMLISRSGSPVHQLCDAVYEASKDLIPGFHEKYMAVV